MSYNNPHARRLIELAHAQGKTYVRSAFVTENGLVRIDFQCVFGGEMHTLTLEYGKVMLYLQDRHAISSVQVTGDLNKAELLQSGICGKCFDDFTESLDVEEE